MDEFEHKEFLLVQPYIVPLEYISLDDHELIKKSFIYRGFEAGIEKMNDFQW